MQKGTKNSKKIFLKERGNSGVTLIALVITVIVLLILAGVAVSLALNQDNIFEKANEAKTSWNAKVEEENVVNDTLAYIEQYIDGSEGNYEVYELGEEVTVGGEKFFVITENDNSNNDSITLLSKYPLSLTETNTQKEETFGRRVH